MKVLVTGANGFIGRNLCRRLTERADIEVVSFTSEDAIQVLPERLLGIDFVVHLAGANRPSDPSDFMVSNHALTELLCDAVARESRATGRKIPILFASSIQAERNDSPYAQSKRAAEQVLLAASEEHAIPVHIFRLPNVFGKWCRPNYNSVVATFCWNIARGLPIDIRDPNAPLTLVYIDDVVERFIQLLDGSPAAVDANAFELIGPQYQTTVGRLADHIREFRESRTTLTAPQVGTGFLRGLNATYLSYLPEEDFAYPLKEYADARGKFVEVLKTPENGQFSYFTAVPGVTRGGHYHHTKAEKFLVLKGRARFRLRHILDGREREVVTSGEQSQIVEIVPGWAHDITNIGTDELIVMLWANEVFDPQRPDTYSHAT
ncbi:UDP-2-acetamido-2,6-beta-L-arabino-hexul-4-ose reductase [Hyphomicrobium sp. 1Nfss2.1]|uniref:UDP-2-acetamido-2,6-beta-L-arabino-hexul-4-ose reductase n=1 Tax=Hyphomicrobium sp. 1Nfss2.1 TaxID=3413936 RepID=UPI003C7E82C8